MANQSIRRSDRSGDGKPEYPFAIPGHLPWPAHNGKPPRKSDLGSIERGPMSKWCLKANVLYSTMQHHVSSGSYRRSGMPSLGVAIKMATAADITVEQFAERLAARLYG